MSPTGAPARVRAHARVALRISFWALAAGPRAHGLRWRRASRDRGAFCFRCPIHRNEGTHTTMSTNSALQGVEVIGAASDATAEILTPDALAFVAALHRAHNSRRKELLARRVARAEALANGVLPDFLPETAHIREGDWTVAPIPADLLDRRTEITGPVDRKMIINALNSGAKVFMADFEDANTPTWDNTIEGQVNLRDAAARTIEFSQPDGKHYSLNDTIATLLVRPARLAPGRKARARRRRADLGVAVRFRPVLLPQPRRAQAPGHRSVLLPAQDGEPPRSAAVERRVHPGPGRARGAAGHDQGHGADRDRSWPPSRWTRSSTSCASTRPA